MRRALPQFLTFWLCTLALGLCAGQAGLRLNTSASVPRGFYWLSSESPQRGDYVAVCPPKGTIFELAMQRGYFGRGRCPSGHAELIKVLAAGPGDHVRIDESGVRVGEHFWPSSAPLTVDGAGRALLRGAVLHGTVASGSVLVMSQDCPSGFDGRYFGLLPHSALVAAAVPLLTW